MDMNDIRKLHEQDLKLDLEIFYKNLVKFHLEAGDTLIDLIPGTYFSAPLQDPLRPLFPRLL